MTWHEKVCPGSRQLQRGLEQDVRDQGRERHSQLIRSGLQSLVNAEGQLKEEQPVLEELPDEVGLSDLALFREKPNPRRRATRELDLELVSIRHEVDLSDSRLPLP